jgi:pyruvate dehydrogenase E2 component (dihydrolipoamide acetyltransferase)
MEEGTFVEWLKREGDRVSPGEALFVLESDKSAENIEAIDAGILRLAPDSPKSGERVRVGQVIAYLAAEGEEVLLLSNPVPRSEAREERAGSVSDGNRTVANASGSLPIRRGGHGEELLAPAITPRARRAAREHGIDYSSLQGTGSNGRIRERDVLAVLPSFSASAATPGDGQSGKLIPHTAIRRTIASRMVAGVTQTAPVTLFAKVDATNLVNLRGQFRSAWNENAPSITDLVVKLTASALRQHPLMQAQWREDGLFVPQRIDIAIGVDTENGLLAPVFRDVDRLSLRQLAESSREQIALARTGTLPAEQMRYATFTVTNLGMFGIDAFTPIIHLPQCAVLGVGRIIQEPAVWEGAVVPRERMLLSLTFDHRVVDGAPAARFLQTLTGCIEQPATWLVP